MPFRVLDATKRSTKATALAKKFESRIISQEPAKRALVNLLEKVESGMYDTGRPRGSLLFLGPTGSGKTATAEAFVEGLFGDAARMMKVDCAEFQHSHEIAKLVGSPPGYLGHRETHPFFTNLSVLEARTGKDSKEIMPFTVVLWDEIEKASDALWNLMLGILDKGVLTTGTNERVTEMANTVHIMTSNIGAAEMDDTTTIGYQSDTKIVTDEKLEAIARAAARKKFSPEFLNRLDHIVMFKTLTPEDIKQVLSLSLEKVQDRVVLGSGVPLFEIRVTERGLKQLLDAGYDRRYNARNLNREVERSISEPLTRLIATNQINHGDIVVCDYLKDAWTYAAVQKHATVAEDDILSAV